MPARSNHLMQIAIDCYSYLPSQSLQVLSNPSIEKDAGGQKGCLHRWISVPIMIYLEITSQSLCTITFLPLKSGLTLWKLGLHVYHFSHFSGCHTGKWPTLWDIPMIFLWFQHDVPMIFLWFPHGFPMGRCPDEAHRRVSREASGGGARAPRVTPGLPEVVHVSYHVKYSIIIL